MSTLSSTRGGCTVRTEQSKRAHSTRASTATSEIRHAYDEARALVSSLDRATVEVRDLVRKQLETRPYMTLTMASAFGYIFGGGPPARLAGLLLGFGSRIGLELFVRDLIRQERSLA
jgi:hypothetical protein